MGAHTPPRAQDLDIALAEAIAAVHHAGSSLAVAQALVERARTLVSCGYLEALLRQPTGESFVHAETGEAPHAVASERLEQWLRQSTRPLLAEPLPLPPGTPSPGPEVSGWLLLPVVAPGRTASGVLQLVNPEKGAFEPADLSRLAQLVMAAGLAVERVLATDITEREQALARVTQAEEQFRLIGERFQVALEAAQMAVWETNFATGQVFRSEGHDRLYGYPEPLEEWTHEMFLQSLHPDDRPLVEAQVAGIFSGEVGDYTSTYRTRWPDGSWHWLISRARVLRDAEGQPEVVRGALLDITAMKETEQALTQAVRVRDDFLSLASHELKTPLAVLSLQLQALRRLAAADGATPLAAPKVQARLEATERTLRRMGALVDNLLDVSRIHHGKLDFHFAPGDLAALVSEVVSRAEEQARQASVVLSSHVQSPLEGHFDWLRLEQVLANLLSNALRYGEGSPVEIRLERTAEGARLMVRDSGPGIPESDRERIFERFEQVASTPRSGGLGLGLFIVRQIVEGHRGRVHVEPGPDGRGTTFVIHLPLTPP